jgi:hypothetical protein
MLEGRNKKMILTEKRELLERSVKRPLTNEVAWLAHKDSPGRQSEEVRKNTSPRNVAIRLISSFVETRQKGQDQIVTDGLITRHRFEQGRAAGIKHRAGDARGPELCDH